ncbi:MAG: hypothetical protein IIB44_09780 [Candidatus Marinimicrobia bacterium]|nr:hypothetical protein [Candidatus Neomarinimicrobiota bacterium]
MKYFKFIFFSLVILTSCGKEPSRSKPEPTLSFSPQTLSINTGQQGEFTIQIEDLDSPVFGISMRIAYDSSIVSFSDSTGFSVGDFFGTDVVAFTREEVSIIHLTVTLTQGQEEVSGSGGLGVLTFVGKSSGTSTVNITSSELYFYDSNGNEVIVPDLKIENAIIAVQ